jgi:hypothetical protein
MVRLRVVVFWLVSAAAAAGCGGKGAGGAAGSGPGGGAGEAVAGAAGGATSDGGSGGATSAGGSGGAAAGAGGTAGGVAGAAGTAAGGAGGVLNAPGGSGGAVGGAAGIGAGGKGGGVSVPSVTGSLKVTLAGAPASFPILRGSLTDARVDVIGLSSDLTRSIALSIYPAGMSSGSFTCAAGGQTSMTLTYSAGTMAMPAAATADGCAGTFSMIPTSPAAGGRLVGTFAGTVGTIAATDGMVDVTFSAP